MDALFRPALASREVALAVAESPGDNVPPAGSSVLQPGYALYGTVQYSPSAIWKHVWPFFVLERTRGMRGEKWTVRAQKWAFGALARRCQTDKRHSVSGHSAACGAGQGLELCAAIAQGALHWGCRRGEVSPVEVDL